MIYNLSMFGTNIFAVSINYDVIGIQATGSLETCGRTIFKIVLPTDDFETIKNGITVVAILLQYFPCLRNFDYNKSTTKAATEGVVE